MHSNPNIQTAHSRFNPLVRESVRLHAISQSIRFLLFTRYTEIAASDDLPSTFKVHLASMWGRRRLWALCFRSDLLLRGNATNNYVEASFRVLKDSILRRTKALTIVHLVVLLCVR